MSELPEALTRSETKGKLLKHLQMDEETYALLAKEADVIYKQLVGNPKNLKPSRANVKPPYDWNDICERSRHEAVHKLAEGTNRVTAYWWQVGSRKLRENDLPWLPVFILYKTFRHRDGRAKSRHHGSPPQYAASTSTSAAMQDPADPTGDPGEDYTHRSFYDPVREGYRKR